MNIKKRIIAVSHHKLAPITLFLLSFIESSFFPIPPDALLIPMVIIRRSRFLFYALITTIGSVLGGILGYVIGFVLEVPIARPLLEWLHLSHHVVPIEELFVANVFGAMFFSAFTPIPYKAFTILGGIFHVHVVPFIIGSFLGRGLRFLIEAYIFARFSEPVAQFAMKHVRTVSLIIGVLVIIWVIFQVAMR
jgi:membrane protein YqaA with SNARE-associated domain